MTDKLARRGEKRKCLSSHLDKRPSDALLSLEESLADMSRVVPGDHPILAELRDAILLGRRILARSAEIARRI